MQGKAGAPWSFSMPRPHWTADVVCHEGQSGKNQAFGTVLMANLLDPITVFGCLLPGCFRLLPFGC